MPLFPGSFFRLTLEIEPSVIGPTGQIAAEDVEKAICFVKQNIVYLREIWEDADDLGPCRIVPV